MSTILFFTVAKSTISEAFFRTLQTLAFMFKEDAPNSERFIEIFLALFGVFLIWWILWSVADMLLAGNSVKYIKREFYIYKIRKMINHTIIMGGGRVGEQIAKSLTLKNKEFLIIENDEAVVAHLKNKKYVVIQGDALNDVVLKTAGIMTAKKLVLTLPKTESNIMLTINAKELNPNIEIHSRCDKESLVSKLKAVGAKVVVVPELVAADKIAKELQ